MKKKKLYFGIRLTYAKDSTTEELYLNPEVFLIHKRHLDNDGSIWIVPDMDPIPVRMLKHAKSEYFNEFINDSVPKKLYFTTTSFIKNIKSDNLSYYCRQEFRLGSIPFMNDGNKDHILKPTKNVIDSTDCYSILKSYNIAYNLLLNFIDYLKFKTDIEHDKSKQNITDWKYFFSMLSSKPNSNPIDFIKLYEILRYGRDFAIEELTDREEN